MIETLACAEDEGALEHRCEDYRRALDRRHAAVGFDEWYEARTELSISPPHTHASPEVAAPSLQLMPPLRH